MLTDLRFAVRGLRKAPALSAVAIASLALGIGANVTVFSVAREMILDDVSAAQPDRLARLDAVVTYAQWHDLRRAAVFQDVAFHAGLHDAIWQNAQLNEMIWGMDTSPNFFDVLGVRAAIGRLYTDRDEFQAVAVVSYGFWSKRLHGGGTLLINGRLYTVIGVLPRDYRSVMGHGVAPEIYAPVRTDAGRWGVFGRLRNGMTRGQARQALAAAVPSLGIPEFTKQLPGIRPFSGFAANAAAQGDDRRMFVFFAVLAGVAALLALIACSNVAGLLLARRISRHREMAIRHALGANRWQLTRPLLGEAIVLVAAGAAVGLALDAWLRSRLSVLRWPTAYNIPFEFHFQSDRGLLAYALLTALVALAVCVLGTGGRRLQPAHRRVRDGFVAVQVVLSMVLLTLGALFARSFLHVARADPGFDAAHTLIAVAHPLPRADRGRAWRQRLIEAVRRVPGVEEVTSTDLLPLMGEVPAALLRREGEAADAAHEVYSLAEGERYFATLRIPILRGRDFEVGDRDRQPIPTVINRSLARQYFGNADPIGGRLIRGSARQDVLEIVGVAADSKMRTLGESPAPAFYTPDFNGQLLVRVSGNPAQWVEPLRTAMAAADPTPALDIRPMRDAVAGALFPIQVAAAFVGSFSGIGLLLALVGVYGSVSYAVSRRTREMGIRSALGATRARIVWTALREAAIVLAAGSLLGLLFALVAVRPLADLVPDGVDPNDPKLFATVLGALLVTGLSAAAIPATRAATIDPSTALRED